MIFLQEKFEEKTGIKRNTGIQNSSPNSVVEKKTHFLQLTFKTNVRIDVIGSSQLYQRL